MSLNAATIEYLLAKGLTGDDLLAVAQHMEASGKPRSASAARQARYRQRKMEGVTSDVTNDVTVPLKDNSKPHGSEANASGAEAPDPVKQVFDVGVALLVSSGTPDRQARSLIGKWRKARGDGEVLTALLDCRARSIQQPVEWLEARFKVRRYASKSGYEYRSNDPEAVAREAEKRADWDTYWGCKADIREAEAAKIGKAA